MKICMLSSVHSADDVRIVEKEARSLSLAGHAVTVIARPPYSRNVGNIEFKVIELSPVPRWKRPWVFGREAIRLAQSIRADVIQFHDPELIPFALSLKRETCKVVYDVHEDVPADIHSKQWIPSWMRPLAARSIEFVERMAASRFDAVVAATPAIADRFRSYGARVSVVRNSVRLDEFVEPTVRVRRRKQAVYVGRITFDRGLMTMVEVCARAQLPLVLAGAIGPEESDWLKGSSSDVIYRGKLDRAEVARLLNESLVGLNLLLPEPNYLYSLPTKLFEYMAAGLAVITSDLPLSKEIVEAAGCGFVVPVEDLAIAVEKLSMLANNPQQAIELGVAGRTAVRRDYNWEQDANELKKLYDDMSSQLVLV